MSGAERMAKAAERDGSEHEQQDARAQGEVKGVTVESEQRTGQRGETSSHHPHNPDHPVDGYAGGRRKSWVV